MAKTKNILKILEISALRNTSHVGSSLSCLDIIEEEMAKGRRVVLSKGHAALAYYVVCWDMGLITDEEILGYCEGSSELYGHVSKHSLFTLGSLGHGLPLAAGYAFGKPEEEITCILGDTEIQEGTTYETLEFIRNLQLDNLKIIIDNNSFGGLQETVISEPLRKYLESFPNLEIRKTVKGGQIEEISKLGVGSHYVKITMEMYQKIKERLCQEN